MSTARDILIIITILVGLVAAYFAFWVLVLLIVGVVLYYGLQAVRIIRSTT